MRLPHKYRLLGKASWGIAINLVAEYGPVPPGLTNVVAVSEDLRLALPHERLTDREVFFVTLGLRLVADAIRGSKPVSGPLLIRVVELEYNPTDYQPEGLAGAIAEWAAEAFHFPKPAITAAYDKPSRRYVFSFEPWGDLPVPGSTDPVALRQTALRSLRQAHDFLGQNRFAPAAESAGVGVRCALQALLPSPAGGRREGPGWGRSDVETIKVLLSRQPHRKQIPPVIGRHLARIRTWYPDLRLAPPSPRRQDVEAFLLSADQVVSWVNEEACHEPVG
jgi:hypothetical protein